MKDDQDSDQVIAREMVNGWILIYCEGIVGFANELEIETWEKIRSHKWLRFLSWVIERMKYYLLRWEVAWEEIKSSDLDVLSFRFVSKWKCQGNSEYVNMEFWEYNLGVVDI